MSKPKAENLDLLDAAAAASETPKAPAPSVVPANDASVEALVAAKVSETVSALDLDGKIAAAVEAIRPKREAAPSRKASIGRIVHFRIGGTDEEPELRPATIVRCWGAETCNLQVEFDGTNDLRHGCQTGGPGPDVDEATRGRGWRTSVLEGEGVGQWRWPAKA